MTLRKTWRSERRGDSLAGGSNTVRGLLFEGAARLGMSLALLVIGCVPVSFLSSRALGTGPQCVLCSRLVSSGYRTKTDRQTVPSVDDDNCQGQINQLLFAEAAASLLVYIIWHMLRSPTSVTASVQASATRSRSVKKGVSSHVDSA